MLRSNCAADLCLWFGISRFSHDDTQIIVLIAKYTLQLHLVNGSCDEKICYHRNSEKHLCVTCGYR